MEIAVGIPITGHPPHSSRQPRFPHWAFTLGVWRQTERLAKGDGEGLWQPIVGYLCDPQPNLFERPGVSRSRALVLLIWAFS